MLIVDAHEDLAWNMCTFERDYTRSALWTRHQESDSLTPSRNGNTLLGKSEWLLGHVGLIFATLFVAPARHSNGEWDTQCYSSPGEAHSLARAQLDAYHRLASDDDVFHLVGTRDELEEVVASWGDEKGLSDRKIGLLPLMEGADPILEPKQVEAWFEWGIRVVGLSWEATAYAGGTHEPGPLTAQGMALLEAMEFLGVVLDVSHLAEEASFQALERYEGPVIASHANPRHFCPTARGLSDEMIMQLAERDGVVGIVPYNAFLKPGWQKGDRKDAVRVVDMADAIDYVCQLTGSADHVAIGTDFDGGFGVEHVPAEIDTVADLHKLREPLAERNYTAEQIDQILSGNWLRVLHASLPE